MKNVFIALVAVILFASCEKADFDQSHQTVSGMPEVNLHSVVVTDSLIKGTIQNISPRHDYFSEIHGRVYLILEKGDQALIQYLDHNALAVIKHGKTYCFELPNPFKQKRVHVSASFENEFSTKPTK